MLAKLLKKELTLSIHPTTPIFLLLSLMVFIPNYPYMVVFFYTTLGIFFICLTGRENNDVIYTMNLPVKKKDIVKARFSLVIILELFQVVLVYGCSLVKQIAGMAKNQAGFEANLVLVAAGLVCYGLFNLVFFGRYYRNVAKVGISFVLGSVIFFVEIMIEEVITHAVPYVRDELCNPDSQNLLVKLLIVSLALIIYVSLTAVAFAISTKRFEQQDI